MGILDKFEKICAIEHCSFDALKLRDYLVEFAKDHGYSVEIDEFDNRISSINTFNTYSIMYEFIIFTLL